MKSRAKLSFSCVWFHRDGIKGERITNPSKSSVISSVRKRLS